MSGHTPGPWKWSQGIDDWELVGADANRVMFRWNDPSGLRCGLVAGAQLKEADANLIAAAPDLLEALTSAVTVLESCATARNGRCCDYVETRHGSMLRVSELIESARKAIAKAEGRTDG